MNMKEKFGEIIKEQLPAMVGQELNAVLQDYEKIKRDLAASEELVVRTEKQHKIVCKHRDELQKIVSRIEGKEADLDKLLLDNKEIANNAEVRRLKHEVDCAKASNDQIFRLTETVFKSPRYHKTISGSQDRIIPDSNGYTQTHNENNYKTETTDIE